MERLFNLKIVKSGDRVELYQYQGYLRQGIESNNRKGRKGKGLNNKTRARKDTLIKARNNIIRIVSTNTDFKTFLTLTYADNMQDLKKSKEHLDYFFKKLKKDYKDLKFIYVLEFQERGAIHYHLLININLVKAYKGKKSKEHKEIENKFNKKYWNRGFIDLKALNNSNGAAKYLASYLVKDLIDKDLQGTRVYSYSRNVDKPIIETLDNKKSLEELINDFKGYKITYTSSYDIQFTDKQGRERVNKVNYIDLVKECSE